MAKRSDVCIVFETMRVRLLPDVRRWDLAFRVVILNPPEKKRSFMWVFQKISIWETTECYRVLQSITVCCRVLLCVAAVCVVQLAVWHRVLQSVVSRCRMSECIAAVRDLYCPHQELAVPGAREAPPDPPLAARLLRCVGGKYLLALRFFDHNFRLFNIFLYHIYTSIILVSVCALIVSCRSHYCVWGKVIKHPRTRSAAVCHWHDLSLSA